MDIWIYSQLNKAIQVKLEWTKMEKLLILYKVLKNKV